MLPTQAQITRASINYNTTLPTTSIDNQVGQEVLIAILLAHNGRPDGVENFSFIVQVLYGTTSQLCNKPTRHSELQNNFVEIIIIIIISL